MKLMQLLVTIEKSPSQTDQSTELIVTHIYCLKHFCMFFSMHYTEAAVNEAIRVFAGQSFSIPHRAMSDSTLLGHFIPKAGEKSTNFIFLMRYFGFVRTHFLL
jgi:hypothetical protein